MFTNNNYPWFSEGPAPDTLDREEREAAAIERAAENMADWLDCICREPGIGLQVEAGHNNTVAVQIVDWDKGEIVRDLTVSYDGSFDGRNTRDSYIISMEGKKEVVVPTMLDVERYVRAYAAFAKLEESTLKTIMQLLKS